MPEELSIVVNSEQVDVLAPPAEIRVNAGVGATGQRGSLFYSGTPAPAAFFTTLGISPNVLDLYLQTNTQQMYQFVSSPAGNVWSVLFDMSALLISSAGYGTFIQESSPALATGQVGFWIQVDADKKPLGLWIVTGD